MVQSEAAKRNALHELGYKIFLDRYAQKDMTRSTLKVGDTVIVVVDSATGQREIGKVTAMNLPQVTIELLDGDVVTRDLEHVDKPLETDPADMMARVARGIASVEATPEQQEKWAERFRWLMDDWKFVPAGRILAAAGTDQELTFYNCMPPEQEILTNDGYKAIADVKIGELVVTHRNRLRPVLHKFERETEEPVYIIRPAKLGYDDLRLTGDHKVYIIRSEWVNKHKSRDGLRLQQQPDWIPAKEIHAGDYVAVAYNSEECLPETIHISDYLEGYEVKDGKLFKATTRGYHGYVEDWGTHYLLNNALVLDKDLCYLFGRWLGDGCVTHRTKTDIPSGIKIVFGLDEKSEAEEIARIISDKFGIEPALKLSSTERWYDLWVNSMPIGQFFKAFLGCYSHSKRITEQLTHLPNELTQELLRGLFSADGYVSGDYIGMVLSNRVLATQVHQLLLRLGYFFSIKENTHRLGKTPAYRLSAIASECPELFEIFFNVEAPKTEKPFKAYLEYDGLRWVRIDEIAVEDYNGIVMDIEVQEDHSFISAGVVVSNCYVVPSPKDSRHGIIETLRQMTEIMSRGGGVGINISTLRPRHGYVKGVNGRSSGSVSWGALYSFVTGLIEQGGSRRGALMLILNDWHPDIFDFINSKRKMGQITNANISVGVSDKLMEAVKADADWDLMFPDTTYPDYTLTWDGDLDKWIASGRRVVKHRTVKAREVWNAIIESAWASAEPGVWFNERANKMSNSFYFNPLVCTNPCHSGDNLIHTREGLVPIRDLVGKEFEVISDLRTIDGVGVHYERAIAYRTGHEQLYEVKLKTGHTVELTGNHKVFTRRGKVQVQDLKVRQDAVLLQSAPHLDALLTLDENYLKQGRIVGWNAGDGWLSEFPSEHQGTGVNVGFIFNQEETYARDYVLEYINQTTTTSRPVTARLNQGCWEIQTSNANAVQLFKTFGLSPKSRKRVTSEIASAPLAFRIGFLQGLFSSDGHIGGYKHSKTGNILLVTVNKGLATGVQILLSDLGIKTYLRTRQAKGIRYVTKDGEIKLSKASLAYTVRIAGQDGIRRFARLVGFPMSTEKQTKLDNQLSEMEKIRLSLPEYWSEVVSITPTRVEDVYNLTTEISHSLIANGIVVSNCGEQSIGAWSVCNLGAINLAKFYDESTNDVAWNDLADAAAYGAHFLDNVIDATPYFFEENRERQLGERRVGLGIMGLAELMIQLGIRYGSDEGVAFTEKLFKFLTEHSYLESARVAAEKGAFTEYDKRFLDSGFMQRVKEELPHVYENIEKQGMRNVTVLTVAPTGTTGTMVNTSTGIEPFFSWVYYRKSRLGLHEEQVPLVKDWYAQNPDAEHLPEYFVTAMDLAPEEHVRMQAAAQKWVDSSISKTANLPNNYTVEQVSDLYKYMYELGCKGGTIYRDGSRNEQVLMLKGDERAEKEMENKSKSRETEKPEKVEQTATPHRVYPRPEKLSGATVKCTTPFGTAYVTMNSDENGYPFEVFITAPGKAGSDLQADAEGLGRMVSLALRTTAPQNRLDMLRLVIEQLKDIGGTSRVGFGPSRVNSLPDALANVLQNYYLAEDAPQQMALPMNSAPKVESTPIPLSEKPKNGNGKKQSYDICPSCNNATLLHAEGCATCVSCGYSRC